MANVKRLFGANGVGGTESVRSTLARESSVYCSFDRFHLYTGSSSSPLYKEGLLQRMNNEMFNTLIMINLRGECVQLNNV